MIIKTYLKKIISFFSYAVVFFSTIALSFAGEPFELSENMRNAPIGRHIDLLEDKSGNISIDNLIHTDNEDQFKWIQSEKPTHSFGFTKSVYWVRFSVINPFCEDMSFYLIQAYPMIDHVDLYIPQDGGRFKIVENGDALPFGNRKVEYRDPAFEIEIPAYKIKTFYLRYKTTSSLNIPLVIYSPGEFMKQLNRELPVLWIYYGLLISLVIYNLFLFFSVKDVKFLYFVLFISFYSLFQMTINGFTFQYLWPNAIWWANNCLPFFICAAYTWGVIFASVLIDFKNKSPKNYTVAKVIVSLGILGILLSLAAPYRIAIIYATLLMANAVYFIFAIFYLALKGNRQAVFFITSYAALLIGITVFALKTFAILPHNFFTQYALQIGSAIQAIILAIVLTDQINTLKNSLQVLNINLENKVEERTRDLKEARDQLWSEMEIAKKIQTILLPEHPSIKAFDIACFMGPADSVGGDYYDIINSDGRDWIVIGDVSGHGVPAGLVMMMVQTAIHAVLKNQPDLSPNRLLNQVNSVLVDNIHKMDEDKYMTITVFACHDNGMFTFSGLHQDILIFRSALKKVEIIETNGMWIGITENNIENMLCVNQLTMEKDDIMLLYTDGIVEAKNKGDEMYSNEKLVDVFETLCISEKTPTEIKSGIIASLKNFNCKDDVTLVILKKFGKES